LKGLLDDLSVCKETSFEPFKITNNIYSGLLLGVLENVERQNLQLQNIDLTIVRPSININFNVDPYMLICSLRELRHNYEKHYLCRSLLLAPKPISNRNSEGCYSNQIPQFLNVFYFINLLHKPKRIYKFSENARKGLSTIRLKYERLREFAFIMADPIIL
jgi:hypothetical protein